MQSFLLSAEIVLPLFLLLGLGWLLKKRGVLNSQTFEGLNELCFFVLLPVTLFQNIYQSTLSTLNRPKFILFAIACQLFILLALVLCGPLIQKELTARAAMLQGVFRINLITFGFAIVGSIGIGEAASLVSMLAGVLVPVFNVGSIFLLEHYCNNKVSVAQTLLKVIASPFVIALALALFFLFTGLRLPSFLEKTVLEISKMSAPSSLIALGGSISFASAGKYRREIAIGVLGRLMIVPALVLPVCILFGFRGAELLALLVMLISPTAVAGFNMARKMGADSELAGHLVVFQSSFSIVTIFIWVWLYNSVLVGLV